MIDIINSISGDVIEHIENGGLLAAMILLFVSAMIEYIFPPFPGDTITLFGAFLIGAGIFPFLPIFLSICLGSLLGTMVVYTAGLKLGLSYFKKKKFKLIPLESLASLQQWFNRWGGWPLAVNRFIPAYRALIILGAGFSGMKFHKVLIFSSLSIIMWNGIIMLVGFALGNNWEKMLYILKTYTAVVVLAISLSLLVFILIKWRRARKNRFRN